MPEFDSRSVAISRRGLLQAGSLGVLGLSLPQLLRAENAAPAKRERKVAKSCILIFLEGGPSHICLLYTSPSPRD